jgi:high-affinity nickel permease
VLAENFELFGYFIAGLFALTWLTALAVWKIRRYDQESATEVSR